jgi:hypothetical protein
MVYFGVFVVQIRQSSTRSDQLRYLKHLKYSLISFLFMLRCCTPLKEFYSMLVYLRIILIDTIEFAKNSYLLRGKIQSFAPRLNQCSFVVSHNFCLLFRSTFLPNITMIDNVDKTMCIMYISTRVLSTETMFPI